MLKYVQFGDFLASVHYFLEAVQQPKFKYCFGAGRKTTESFNLLAGAGPTKIINIAFQGPHFLLFSPPEISGGFSAQP